MGRTSCEALHKKCDPLFEAERPWGVDRPGVDRPWGGSTVNLTITPRSHSWCTDCNSFLSEPSFMWYLLSMEWPICIILHLSALNFNCQVLDHVFSLSKSSCKFLPDLYRQYFCHARLLSLIFLCICLDNLFFLSFPFQWNVHFNQLVQYFGKVAPHFIHCLSLPAFLPNYQSINLRLFLILSYSPLWKLNST